jgi:CRISPR-associated protein Cas1
MGRIVEVSGNGYSLRIERGSLVLFSKKTVSGEAKLPLDEIDSLIINSNATSLTSSVQISLAQRGIPILFCDSRHLPIAVSLPTSNNYEQSKRIKQQSQISKEKADLLWSQIIRSKILRQSELLDHIGQHGNNLRRIASKVVEGDTSNCEAQAAKIYWKDLFGKNFIRSSDDGVNARLNYGYAILRATVARYVCAHGLSPSLGIHHRNASNPMCLVDDLMEPFRPFVDWKVVKMNVTNKDITREEKQELVNLMLQKVMSESGTTVFESLIQEGVFSFYRVCSEPNTKLKIEWHLLDKSV